MMKHDYSFYRIFICSLFLGILSWQTSVAQVGIGTETPNANAALEINGDGGGLLLPRVSLTSTDSFSPLGAHVAGMTVYNENTTTGANGVSPGFYFNDGTAWIRLAADSGPQAAGWLLQGNTGVGVNDWLGTRNLVGLRIKTNNIDRFEFNTNNQLVSINNGTANRPSYSFVDNINSGTGSTGMYQATTNELAFSTNGQERIRINASGKVGIGIAPNNRAALEINGAGGGLLMPRVALLATNNHSPIGEHIKGMTVYNTATAGSGANVVTEGFYYNNGSRWIRAMGSEDTKTAWDLTGNAGTNPTNNFLGTTDAQAFNIRTNNHNRFQITSGNATIGGRLLAYADGTAATPIYSWQENPNMGMYRIGNGILGYATNGAERMRIINNGRAMINTTSSIGNTRLSVDDNSIRAIIGASLNDEGVRGESGNDAGVVGLSVFDIGVIGQSDEDFGVLGMGLYGAVGETLYFGGTGMWAIGRGNNNFSGIGIHAEGSEPNTMAIMATGNGVGGVNGAGIGVGSSFAGSSFGAMGIGRNSSNGTGFVGLSNNNLNIISPAFGAGVIAAGNKVGISAYANNYQANASNSGNAAGSFSLGTSPIGAPNTMRSRAEIAGYQRGPIAGEGTNSSNNYFGGYFEGGTGTGAAYAYVGLKQGTDANGTTGTNYKILGSGNVSTLVNDNEGNKRILFASEAPEILFEDYGIGQLQNGQVYIQIDPLFSKSIYVSDKHPLKVFIQLEGECNGVYVTDKTANGFLVKELNGGKSNIPFSYHLVANRADDIAPDGSITSKHVGLRFPIGPGPMTPRETELKELKDANSTSGSNISKQKISAEQLITGKNIKQKASTEQSSNSDLSNKIIQQNSSEKNQNDVQQENNFQQQSNKSFGDSEILPTQEINKINTKN